MESSEKINVYSKLNRDDILPVDKFYEALEICGDLKTDYYDYMTTKPIDCEVELLRLPTADYKTCCALLTMLLRADHFSNGSFSARQRKGQVKPIIERMIVLLSDVKDVK